MALTKLSQLLFTLNLFDGNSWNNFFSGLGAFFGRIFYAVIICGLGRIADICQLIFKKLAGISPNGVQFIGENGTTNYSGDIVMYIIQSSAVKNVLIALLVLAVVILLIATFTAVIKTEFAKDGNNNKRKVIKYAFRGLANFVLVPVICIFGLFIGNALLRAVDGATNPSGGQTTLSAQIFLAGGYNANRARQSETKDEASGTLGYIADSFGARLVGQGDYPGTANFGIFLDDDPGILNARRAADKIDECFAQGYLIKVGDAGVVYTQTFQVPSDWTGTSSGTSSNSYTINLTDLDIWYDGAFGTDININVVRATDYSTIYVDGTGVMTINSDEVYIPFNIYNIGLVYTYYNLNLGSFDYLVSAIALIFCAYTLLVAVLGLIKRLFYLSTLFFISAPICAIYPLDEGKALERWRADFIKNTLSAYSIIVVLNLFLSLLPILLKMELFIDWSVDLFPLPIPLTFANYLARLLIVIGALTFFKDATKQIAAIIGAGDSNSDGSDASGKFNKNVTRVASGTAVAAGGVAAATKFAVGGTARLGRGIAGKISNSISEKRDNSFKSAMEKQMDEQAKLDAQNDVESKANNTNKNASDSNSINTKPGTQENVGKSSSSTNELINNQGDSSSQNVSADGKTKKDNGLFVYNNDGSIDWHATRLDTEERNRKQNYIDNKTAKEARKNFKNGGSERISEEMIAKAEKQYNSKLRKQDLINFGHGVAKVFKTGKNAVSTAFKPVRGAIDAISGISKGDLKAKDATKWTAGSRAEQKKAKEKAAQSAESKAQSKMRNEISEISAELKKQKKESEDLKKSFDEQQKKLINNKKNDKK